MVISIKQLMHYKMICIQTNDTELNGLVLTSCWLYIYIAIYHDKIVPVHFQFYSISHNNYSCIIII
jgi:hypothetical protein